MTDAESKLAQRYREASSRWTGIKVSLEAFVGAVISAQADGPSVDELHTDDLYLALGCLDAQPAAIAVLEREVMTAVRPTVERASRNADVSADDVLQWTREKLLLGSHGAPPKLTHYKGHGALVGWVRVVAIREALQERRRSQRQRTHDDASLLVAGTPGASMELTLLRARYGAAFRTAVQEGLRRLSTEQRTILRFHTHHRLSIDQLALMLGIHRATAARRLEKARRDALSHTYAVLREEHGLSESEAKSLCLALEGEVDVSIGRALGAEAIP